MTFSSPEELQAAAKQHLWMHFTRMSAYNNGDIPVIVRGSGPYVYDDKGKRYLDGLAGLFVSMIGHGRTELAEAASKQASELAYLDAASASSVRPWPIIDTNRPASPSR